MTVTFVSLHPRVRAQFDAASVGNTNSRLVANVLTAPNVLRMFHLITAHALTTLASDSSLLARLEANFSESRVLSDELGHALEGKGLTLNVFGDPSKPIFYSLSGTNQAELRLLDEMGEDFSQNPTLEDIGICFETFFGITITSAVKLNPQQLKTFNQVFDPRGEAISLLAQRGITRLALTSELRGGIEIVTEEKTGDVIMSMPANEFNIGRNAFVLILGALGHPHV